MLAAAALSGVSLGAHAPQGAAAPQVRETADPAVLLRERIALDYALAGASAPFAVTDRPVAELRRLIRDRIDPRLLTGATTIRGSDYRFTPADGGGRHAGLVVIRYASASIATARVRPWSGDRHFFRGTMILTPMAVATRGDTLAVFFTESGGDTKLRAALSGAARRFQGS